MTLTRQLNDNVHALPGASLSDKAYLLIRNKILKGEFPLGAPLSRRKLAAEFHMSFLPISEAVQRLETEGLVESKPRVGTRVRVPTAEDLRDRYIIREALECQSARLFCERATAAERKSLIAAADRLEKRIESAGAKAVDPDFQFSVHAAHVALHMRIAECSGCALLCDLIEKNQLLIFNWFYDVAAGYRMEGGRHRELVKVITGKDPDAACLAMGRHVRSGMSEIQAGIAARYRHPLLGLNRLPQDRDGVPNVAISAWRMRTRVDGRSSVSNTDT